MRQQECRGSAVAGPRHCHRTSGLRHSRVAGLDLQLIQVLPDLLLQLLNSGPTLCAIPWQSVPALWQVPCIVEDGGLEINKGFSVRPLLPI